VLTLAKDTVGATNGHQQYWKFFLLNDVGHFSRLKALLRTIVEKKNKIKIENGWEGKNFRKTL
jgi:hypothetical protein